MPYQSYQDIASVIEERPYLPYYIWECAEPRAIMHIVHGMSENAERYNAMAEWFCKHNILVVSHDHLGHGPLAKTHQRLGFFSSENAGDDLSEDLRRVIVKIKALYPGLPYFVIGHSMGAYITRIFLGKHSGLIDGAAFSGTNAYSPLYRLGSTLAPLLNKHYPRNYNYRIHRALFGTGISECEYGPITDLPLWHAPKYGAEHDWPLVGFVFTNNGFAELAKMAYQATRYGWANDIRRNLPLLIMNGMNDPLIRKGKDIEKIAKELKRKDFQNVTFQTYYRRGHEIFMYSGTEDVYADLLRWIEHQIEPKPVRK